MEDLFFGESHNLIKFLNSNFTNIEGTNIINYLKNNTINLVGLIGMEIKLKGNFFFIIKDNNHFKFINISIKLISNNDTKLGDCSILNIKNNNHLFIINNRISILIGRKFKSFLTVSQNNVINFNFSLINFNKISIENVYEIQNDGFGNNFIINETVLNNFKCNIYCFKILKSTLLVYKLKSNNFQSNSYFKVDESRLNLIKIDFITVTS